MLWDSFRRMLQRLNPRLTFEWNTNNAYRTVGVYLKEDDPKYLEEGVRRATFLFGVPRDWVPDDTETDERGAIIRRGWREAVVKLWELGAVVDRDYYRQITRGWRRHAA